MIRDRDDVFSDAVETPACLGLVRGSVTAHVDGDQAKPGEIEMLEHLLEVRSRAGPAMHEEHGTRTVAPHPVRDPYAVIRSRRSRRRRGDCHGHTSFFP